MPPAQREAFLILRAMALQVRMMTPEQIGRGWFSKAAAPQDSAAEVIDCLECAGLIERRVFEARPLIRLTRPLFSWNPGDPSPTLEDFDDLSATSRNRWKEPHEPVEIVTATKTAARLFGAFSDARFAKHSEATHDLHLSEVYLKARNRSVPPAVQWLGEAAFPKLGFEIKGMKDPDAFLLEPSGRIHRVVEFSGVYKSEHLQKFHAHCAGAAAKRLAHHFRSRPSAALAHLYAPGGTSYELW
jgi:hypothetical protein